MKRQDFQLAGNVPWIDVTTPNADDLNALAGELHLPPKMLQSALDPEHLPKVEYHDQVTFVILRCIDPAAKPKADSIGELTTKVVLVVCPKGVLTIHRLDPPFLGQLREKAQSPAGAMTLPSLMRGIVFGAVLTYDEPIAALEKKAEDLESGVFGGKRSSRLLREGFLIRRRASIYRRALLFTSDVISALSARSESAWSDIAESRDRTTRLVYYSEQLVDNVTSLLNLHVSLSSQKTNEASYRTNEIMRVLTVFSIFFLPLNFIAGVYGMNFRHIPELDWEHGYFLVLGLMGVVALAIYTYMRRHGWLKSVDE